MVELRARLIVSFRAKVLVPVITVMVLLLAVTVWVVNDHITHQAESEATEAMASAGAVFRNSQVSRRNSLLRCVRNLPNEPRYWATLKSGDSPTVRRLLKDVMAEQSMDFVLFVPTVSEYERPLDEPVLQRRDQLSSDADFISACAQVRAATLQAPETPETRTDTIRVGDRIYDVVAVPCARERSLLGVDLIGVLVFGEEVGLEVAQQFSVATHGPVALLAGGRVIQSTLNVPDTNEQLAAMFRGLTAAASPNQISFGVQKTTVGRERFFYSGGRLASGRVDNSLGYLVLRSSEPQMRALRATQQMLLGVSLLAIGLGSMVVWLLVRKVTGPLEELRDVAEAVGRGDFSKRVVVHSRDECGELALVFNQMTENLKQSRAQLETTVDTLKTTQAQLVQSEKLSGIGEFVAGVAHELNNPLTSVMGFSELLVQANTDPQQKRYLEMVHKSALRCQKIVQALLSFARRHKPERKAVCVNGLIEAALEILNYQLRTSNIEVTTKLDARLPQAMVDPHQVQQVFLNILNNARQAIEAHQPKGAIHVTTGVKGDNVCVTFRDNGPGIPQKSLSKIFDPFFTTKEIGKGTGLGLSLCYGIIKEHGGTITPRSKLGEGATFVIELPITHAPVAREENARGPETEVINPREGAGKKVLVIDDEQPILHMVRETLSSRGYHVDLAEDGETGLKRLSQTRYDVTLCDWKMPGLTGQEVFERLRLKDPRQSERVIFITGDVVNEKTRRFLEDQKRVCLPKPFTLGEFREAIRRMLASS